MTRADIARLIPHAGAMCLLDGVTQWDATRIRCVSRTHRALDNPLRAGGRLHAVTGVEYAAQAMALHGYLLAASDALPTRGYLASVRDLKFGVEDLDMLPDDLLITARRLGGDTTGFIYEFEIRAAASLVLSGRLAAKLVTGEIR